MSETLRNKILSLFRMHGYTLRSEALKYLESILQPVDEPMWNEVLKKIIESVQSQSLTCALLEKSNLEVAIHASRNRSDEPELLFNVIDAFSLPAFSYNSDSKKFVNKSFHGLPAQTLHGKSDAKAEKYVERHKMIHQRTIRHRLFAPPAIVAGSTDEGYLFSLRSIEYLLGASSKQTNLIVLGMLTQLKEGKFFLEDPTGTVQLDLSQAIYKGGLFTENSIILAEGFYEDSIFHVTAVGFPPPEATSITLSHFGNVNFFGGPAKTSVRVSEKLKRMEEANADSMFIFMSDVWLDQLKVMQKLRILFAGYSQIPPTCFILIGNFLSLPKEITHEKNIQECFKNLGNLISEFPSLVDKSYFVFVPGPNDPGLPHILPRPPIPQALLPEFNKKVPKAIFTTNPCRIQFCSQEIVVFREDIVSKMCRNSIYMPWEHEEKVDIPSLFVKTLIANSHLLPLPLNVAPVYWEFDHALWLYPLPDVVVCADKYDPYTVSSTGCTFFNPGSLLRTDFSFKVYIPANRQVEDSQITEIDT